MMNSGRRKRNARTLPSRAGKPTGDRTSFLHPSSFILHPLKSWPPKPLVAAAVLLLCAWPAPAESRTTLANVCRVRGQEETTLTGLGIVTGLNGTGDGGNSLPTLRSLATMMELMGTPISPGGTSELKDAKNVALVIVTATIPAAGARRGDKIDCSVSAVSAKSLAGGRLFLTPLTGPVPRQDPTVFALAQGPITLEGKEQVTTGRVHGGCRLVEDFYNPFCEDGRITLVVDKDYAGFQVTHEIADLINSRMTFESGAGSGQQAAGRSSIIHHPSSIILAGDDSQLPTPNSQLPSSPLAKAVDQVNIEVTVPPYYRDHLVQFVSDVLSLDLMEPQTGPRVVIRERSGTIVFDGDVEIGPVLVTHKNIVVETGGGAAESQFVAVDSQSAENPKLKALLAALNAVRVPAEDKIEIIKALHRNGKLYAQLIIE